MLSTPERIYKEEQPYVAIRRTINMKHIPTELPPLVPKVKEWLDGQGIEQAGAPFFHYLAMDGNNDIISEVGFPVKQKTAGDSEVISGSFKAGHYAHLTYTGDYKYMKDAHMALEEYIIAKGYKEEMGLGSAERPFGSRAEFYPTDEEQVPNADDWVTEIYVLLKD